MPNFPNGQLDKMSYGCLTQQFVKYNNAWKSGG